MTRPSHHRPDGGFRNPWPESAGDDELRKRFREVAWEWLTKPMPPDPDPADLPLATPEIAVEGVGPGEARITWAGHASFLIQLPGLNLLTDPVWSTRVSPVTFAGTKRFVPAVPDLTALPRIDAVLLSHDHYDHLDRPTVRKLHGRFGDALQWLTPLGYADWFGRLGVHNVVERDWWESTELSGGAYRVTCTPTRHWTRRTPWGTNSRLWCGWALSPADASDPKVYFLGDSGPSEVYTQIGERLGPFDVSLIPIGAYEPRWFMGASHMNPEEALGVYRQVGGSGVFVPMHWGTFRLTFEPPLEPPVRMVSAWKRAGLPDADLRVLRHGETLVVAAGGKEGA